MDYLPYLVTVAAIMLMALISPGPNFIVVTSTAVSVSRRAGIMAGFGIACASFTWALLAIASVKLAIACAEWLYLILKSTGACYCVWLGIVMMRNACSPFMAPDQQISTYSGWVAMRRAYLVSMTNPKALAFFGSIFAVTLPKNAPAWVYAATVIITVVLSATWNCGLAVLFSNMKVRLLYLKTKPAINIMMGLLLVWIGIRMVMLQ